MTPSVRERLRLWRGLHRQARNLYGDEDWQTIEGLFDRTLEAAEADGIGMGLVQELMQKLVGDQAEIADVATLLLFQVASESQLARQILADLARTGALAVRCRIIGNWTPGPPRDFLVDLLRLALEDEKTQVRAAAIEHAIGHQVQELTDQLHQLLESTDQASLRARLEEGLPFLQEGLLFRWDGEQGHATIGLRGSRSEMDFPAESEEDARRQALEHVEHLRSVHVAQGLLLARVDED